MSISIWIRLYYHYEYECHCSRDPDRHVIVFKLSSISCRCLWAILMFL